jgi:hypothetical protein
MSEFLDELKNGAIGLIDRFESMVQAADLLNFKPETRLIDGRRFVTTPEGSLEVLEKTFFQHPDPYLVTVETLTGLVDYVKANSENMENHIIHVESPRVVKLLSPLVGDANQRLCECQAQVVSHAFPFDELMDQETFIVFLLSRFTETDDRADILKLVGNVKDETVANWDDDGVTQRVAARTGIAKSEFVAVKNPWVLAPFRTFPEVEQPASNFILRLKGGGDGKPPMAALFEADGGAWRNKAIANISEFLKDSLPGPYNLPVLA